MRILLSILCLTWWLPIQQQVLERAQTAVAEKDYTQAIILYRKALKQYPSLRGPIYFNLGQTHWAADQVDSAQYYFEQSIHLLPNGSAAEARNNLGFIHVHKKNYVLGIKQFQRALSLNPYNEQARVNFELASILLQSESPPPMKNTTSVKAPSPRQNRTPSKGKGEYSLRTYLQDSLGTLEINTLYNQLRRREKNYVQQLTRRPRKFMLSDTKPNW